MNDGDRLQLTADEVLILRGALGIAKGGEQRFNRFEARIDSRVMKTVRRLARLGLVVRAVTASPTSVDYEVYRCTLNGMIAARQRTGFRRREEVQ